MIGYEDTCFLHEFGEKHVSSELAACKKLEMLVHSIVLNAESKCLIRHIRFWIPIRDD